MLTRSKRCTRAAARDIGETMRTRREGERLEHGRSEYREESVRVVTTGKETRSTRRERGGEVLIWSTRAAARDIGKTMRTRRMRGVEEAMSTRLTQSEMFSGSEG